MITELNKRPWALKGPEEPLKKNRRLSAEITVFYRASLHVPRNHIRWFKSLTTNRFLNKKARTNEALSRACTTNGGEEECI
jgi:hypothetical protein